jgi:alpha-D-ribose 1-methylphosphonate 5-triphosphate synthase subunit PhnG
MPTRPAAGYALVEGTRVASAELAALSDAASAEVDPGE